MTRAGAPDTIAAVATAPGRGGIGIVRVSGPAVPAIATAMLGALPAARRAHLARFRDANDAMLDTGLALYFPAPHSYTGEHVLELHGHGGPVVLDLVLQRALSLGARLARPGEFSERAFLNGKLDLAQAEAVADLIDSGSQAAARAALRTLDGALSRRVAELNEALIALRLHIEAAIDFPEEEIDFLADGVLAGQAAALLAGFDALAGEARQGSLLKEGITVVLAGAPNAGKSSLLNALAQRDSAIVSPLPGTTRDIVREHIEIDGLPLHVLDTAGLRDSADSIETEGVRRARAAMERADRVLLLIDDTAPRADSATLPVQLPPGVPYTRVYTKIDISGRAPTAVETATDPALTELALSSLTGAGLDALHAYLKACVDYTPAEAGGFSARRRHLDALARARARVEQASAQLRARQGELAAEELRLAQQALGEITGEFSADDLLGRIFASFCIGK